MNISELEQILKEMREEHGDIDTEVCAVDHDNFAQEIGRISSIVKKHINIEERRVNDNIIRTVRIYSD